MNNNLRLLDYITILSFEIGILSLYIALQNLDENRIQNKNLKEILDSLDGHLASQDEHLKSQDEILENLTKGD